jgi:hypothetical protein
MDDRRVDLIVARSAVKRRRKREELLQDRHEKERVLLLVQQNFHCADYEEKVVRPRRCADGSNDCRDIAKSKISPGKDFCLADVNQFAAASRAISFRI